jgi:tRNA threonylcarbamoyladenosine biosynthesis protein TsaB
MPDRVRLAPPHLLRQSAVGVALCAAEALRRGETVPAALLRPVYLRLSQAERERRAREAAATEEAKSSNA